MLQNGRARNTKTGVTKACRYDPDLNPTYQEMAMHYGVGVVPARPYKPRDKAKVERLQRKIFGDCDSDGSTTQSLTPAIRGGSGMHRSARTDLCGGRSPRCARGGHFLRRLKVGQH